MALVRMLARPMLASMFVNGGINTLRNVDHATQRAAPVTARLAPVIDRATASLPVALDNKQLVQVNAMVQIVGGAMLATGRSPRLSALALAASLVPTTFAGHRFWEEQDAQQRANQRVHFLKNVSLTGGLLLAAVDTEGKPSLAWRARRQALEAKKQASRTASKITPG
ncbi:MAG: DoxX family protein [Nocardioidaceae bacterium]|nr:DoxX family protein [Nocardioidaceae bacterium]